MRIVEFLAGNCGRWAKAVAGALLIILGVVLGGGGWALAVIGLAPSQREHSPSASTDHGSVHGGTLVVPP